MGRQGAGIAVAGVDRVRDRVEEMQTVGPGDLRLVVGWDNFVRTGLGLYERIDREDESQVVDWGQSTSYSSPTGT